MHASMRSIGSFLRTAGPDNGVQGLSPFPVAAGTTYGPALEVPGFLSCVLTGLTGTATGVPDTQSVAFSLQSSANGEDGWEDVAGSTFTLDEDDSAGEVDVRLTGLPETHGFVRVKVVAAFTGGAGPEQLVAAVITLGGASTLPV